VQDGFTSSGASFNKTQIDSITDSVTVKLDYNYATLSVCGHEWGHAVSSYGADFTQGGEPGSLNEGFADIMGYAVDQYAIKKYNLNFSNPNWLSNYLVPSDGPKRSMKKPTLYIGYPYTTSYPDYYQGVGWSTGGGHKNATVFSHWFYLLSQGTSEYPNETRTIQGVDYNFEGIGLNRALQIVFKAVAEGYAIQNSNFHDMREATINAAIDLGDTCSYSALLYAWDCVGVFGDNYYDNIFINETIDNDTTISANITYQNLKITNNSDVLFLLSKINIISNSNIIVAENSKLDMLASKMYLGENSGIIVEEGCDLVINKSLLTYANNSPNCTTDTTNTWAGITYKGNNQTNLNIKSSTISYSKNGINIDAPKFSILTNSYYNNKAPIKINYQTNNNDTAFIIANTFENSVSFYPHYENNLSFIEVNNLANVQIVGNDFNIDVQNGDITSITATNSNTINSNKILIEKNKFEACKKAIVLNGDIDNQIINNDFIDNGFSNNFNTQNLNNTAVLIFENKTKSLIKNNRFTNFDLGFFGHTISGLNVDSNTFSNCNTSISVYDGMYTQTIKRNYFNTIALYHRPEKTKAIQIFGSEGNTSTKVDSNTIVGLGMGFDIRACENIQVNNNRIENVVYTTDFPDKGYGIFVQASETFEIKDNVITDETRILSGYTPPSRGAHGIIIENAQFGSNKILRNDISNITIGIQTQENNNNLRMKCNTVDAKFAGLLVFDELENQGTGCGLVNNLQQLPGNVWTNTTERNIQLSEKCIRYTIPDHGATFSLNLRKLKTQLLNIK